MQHVAVKCSTYYIYESGAENMNKEKIGYKIRLIHNQIHKRMEEKKRQNEGDLTGMQHWMLMFLNWHRGEDIYQKDVEAEFQVSRATASNMLQVMERKELIERVPVEHDARLKKLVMTEKAERMLKQAHRDMEETEAMIIEGFTEEEIAKLQEYLERIIQNIGAKEGEPTTRCGMPEPPEL